MKKLLLILGLTVAALGAQADSKDKTSPNADRYNVTDASGKLAFGKSYYEVNGRPNGANGNFYSEKNAGWSIKQWPDKNSQKHLVTYLHFPKCTSNAKIQLTTSASVTFKLTVTNMENGEELATQEITFAKGTKQWVDILDTTTFPNSGWYKFDIQCTKGAGNVGEFFYWQFDKKGSTERIYTADYMSSPSVHLSAWKTTDPDAPTPAYYDWVYEEVMVPESSAVVGTYCMSLGILHGYMGIQIDSDNDYPIIFSMWDNGSTDEDPYLPDYLRSGALDWEKGVTIARFANEGTGAQAKYRSGKNWVPGKWVKFISNARPEVIDVEIDDPANPGQKKTITYTNTLCSAWYMAEGKDDDWHYIATIRQSGANNYFDGWYSFLENYNWPTGQWQRKAYYRNGGLHSLSNGKWYHANSVGFGHTDGGSLYGDRRDYGQGMTEDFEDCFFMSTGGYHEDPVQNSKIVPLKRNFMPVDQATLDRLSKRVDQAIRNEQITAMKENISNACVVYPQSHFTVVAKSDEATNEGAANVATAVFDDNESTYWHSKWGGGETPYPHSLTIKVDKPEDIHIGQITLVQTRASNYRAKQAVIATSSDNKTWTDVETVTFEDANRPNVTLAAPLSAPYIRLTFKNGYGGNLLCINEIYFKSAPSLDDLKQQASNILALENQFGGYSSEDLSELTSVYAGGSVKDFSALSAALNNLAANGQPLKFGVVDAMKNLSSFKAYQIHSLDKLGELIATTAGEVKTTTDPINVVDPYSNWLLLHSAKTSTYYLYNLGAKKFLKLESGNQYSLTEDYSPVTVTYTTGGFRFGNTRTWELRDNYVAQPEYSVSKELLEAIDYAADEAVREKKAAAARGFLEKAKEDAALDFDGRYAGQYDTAPLEAVLANPSATASEIAEAYDKVRTSALPKPGRYYRLANYARPTAGAKNNYLVLTGTKGNWSFSSKATDEFGPSPSGTTISENFRLFSVEKSFTDSTFYIYSPATDSYLMTQNADGGVSSAAISYRIAYEGKRLFRMQNGSNYLTISGANKLQDYNVREDAELFYFEEVTTLPAAISTDESGFGVTCLPVAVSLPGTVEAYIATGFENGCLMLAPLNDYLEPADRDHLPAHLPVVLRSVSRSTVEPTECSILPAIDSRKARAASVLSGAPYRLVISRSDYIFDSPASSLKKSPGTGLAANKAYITAIRVPSTVTDVMPIYTEGIRNIIIRDNEGNETLAPASLIYDLNGRIATDATDGITIKDGAKAIRR